MMVPLADSRIPASDPIQNLSGINTGSLARCLIAWAKQQPDAPALVTDDQTLSYQALLNQLADSTAWQTADPATSLAYGTGNNMQLLWQALHANWQGRTFWPNPIASSVNISPADIPKGTELIISTSGSTGAPKAVCLSGENLLVAARSCRQVVPLQAGDCWLASLPLIHIGGQAILWRCIEAGACIRALDKFSVPTLARLLAHEAISHLSLVPAMLAQLLDAGISHGSLKYVLIGGGPLSTPLYLAARDAGWPIYPGYGMSESAAQVACLTPDNQDDWQEGMVGHLLPGMAGKINEEGRLCLRGPQMMQAYLGQDRHLAFDDQGWFETSDLARFDAKGRLFILGRADDIIISGGKNIHPQTIETTLRTCPQIDDIAVLGEPHPVWGQQIVALYCGPADAQTVISWGQQHLDASQRPRRAIKIAAIPRTPLGKIARHHLPEYLS